MEPSPFSRLFQQIWDVYQTSLFNGVAAVISSGLTAAGGLMQVLGVMFIAVFGFLTMAGDLSTRDGLTRIVRLLATQALLTPVYYNAFVADVMLNWLPDWIATSVGGGAGVTSAAAQFDELRNSVARLVAVLAMQLGTWDIAKGIEIRLLGALCELSVALAFFVWVFTRGLLALVVAAGPFIVVANLFDATRPFFANWIGKLVGIAVLLLLVSVLLRIVVLQYDYFIRQAVSASEGAGLEIGISALLGVLLSCVFGLGLLFYIPRIAFAIGTGAAFSPTAGAATLAAAGYAAKTVAGAVVGAAGRAGAAAARGASRAAHVARQAAARGRRP